MTTALGRFLSAVAVLGAAAPSFAQSYYKIRPDDPRAVELTRERFGAQGDGVADDAPALQRAIDTLQETVKQGVLLIPEGRYRLGRTIHVWSGIRLIGYGATRPALVLGEATPGFQEGDGKYLVHFVSWRPRPGEPIRDANPGTFYSAMSNVDIEIRDGNPAAIGVRFHVAQHCYLAHMELRVGSGRAGLEDIGNLAEDLHFRGGEYGILTQKTSPSWPFVLIDSSFEGQRVAAIRTEEAGMTLVRNRFRAVPTVVSINPDRAEELWIEDSRFEEVSGPALVVSKERNPRTQINLQNVVCERVPLLVRFRESGKEIAGAGPLYVVKDLSHGLEVADLGATPVIATTFEAAPLATAPPPVPSDVTPLPAQETWVSLRSLGAAGDGASDDTAVLRGAIAEHRTIFLPAGRYRVSDTITLRPDTVLVGLSPISTVIALDDGTPAFQGPGAPKPLLETAMGGSAIVTGIGLDTGGDNSRAVAAKWTAGPGSLMDDVRFLGGHGTYRIDGSWDDVRRSWERIYNNTHTADPDPKRRWDSQYCSLWITDGGAGVFKDIWSPSTFAQAGVCITNTATEGRIYAMSVEHHVRNEVVLRNAANWRIYGLQTEEERGESAQAQPLAIESSSNLTFANLFAYRVVSSVEPFPYAVGVSSSRDVRFRGLHVYSDSKVAFDASVYDQTQGVELRACELTRLTISGNPPRPRPAIPSSILAPGAPLERLAGGFHDITGAAVDARGDLYFVDTRRQTIYQWSAARRALSIVRDSPLDPAQLGFDEAGNLLVVSYAGKGSVFAFGLGSSESELRRLEPQPAAGRRGRTPLLPVNRWHNDDAFVASATERRPHHYVSPDGRVFIPAGEDFVSGALYYGAKMADVLRAFRLAPARPGRLFYVCEESGSRTYRFTVGSDGTLSEPTLFAEEGGSGTTVDAEGRVYIAAEQVSVYDPSGRRLETIDVPERPTAVVFGGEDGRTLFILTRRSLYAVRTRAQG
jgi:sugar lactone lactonase YvrE